MDLDGTLVDSGPGIMRAAAYALKAFGFPEQEPAALRRFVGPPLPEAFRRFYGMDEAAAQAGVKKYREYYAQKGIFEGTVYPGMEEMLRMLARQGRTLLVATSKPEIYARQVIGHFGLLPYFTYVAGSLPDESRSEKADVIAWALSHVPDADPARTVMVGDRWYDVAGAHQKGIACVGVLYGYGLPGELARAGADRVAADAGQLGRILSGRE